MRRSSKSNPTRRAFCAAAALTEAFAVPDRLRAAEGSARPVRIKDVDIFSIEIPTSADEVAGGKMNRYSVARVETDVGVRGYSFFAGFWAGGLRKETLDGKIRPMLAGKDLFAVDDHLRHGLVNYGAVEHALWDAISQIAGQPAYRLLGGSKTSIKGYVTCVWKGKPDQSDVSFLQQADMAVKLKKAGFKGMKIRAWRPDPMDDVEACREIRAATGPDFAIMFDRTGDHPGRVWDYETAVKVCRGMEKYDAYWMEEPFDPVADHSGVSTYKDFVSPRRLAQEVRIPIVGGNFLVGLDQALECLRHESYDVLQPDSSYCGGILTCVKIAHLCEAYRTPIVLHGTMGLRLEGCVQASAAIGTDWIELALVNPPLLPEEQWSPALKLLKSKLLYAIKDGYLQVPSRPGLGSDLIEEAVNEYRIRA